LTSFERLLADCPTITAGKLLISLPYFSNYNFCVTHPNNQQRTAA